MSSCGAVVGGVSLDRVDVAKEAIIQGVVTIKGTPAHVGYVRLLDKTDEFTAEVPVSPQGEFRFFAAPGNWTVVALVPGGSTRVATQATTGVITDLDLTVN